ncbi:MAG TPA: hypothetical protein VG900_12400 [Hyphomicrobiaceae bacterium]|nr:hypothetical protein [Hyphomicrobiaceae bacterium]
MFRGLINDAKTAAGAVVSKYVMRASVAVPFIVAAGFAIAAITSMLITRYGTTTASWIVAGAFTVIGVIAAAIVSMKEQEEEVADQKAEEADTGAVASEVAMQAPLALLGAILTSPSGASSALSLAKLLGRNLPLVILLLLIGALLWPSGPGETAGEEAEAEVPAAQPAHKPNGSHAPAPGKLPM